jgi:hypothetical protein
MKRATFAIAGVVLVAAVLWSAAGAAIAAPPDEWRRRVRDELATLPKPPAPPDGSEANPVDAFLADSWATRGLAQPQVVDDRAFVRRVYFDLIGLPPDEKAVAAFVGDAAAGKRASLVDRLLGDEFAVAYAEHWMTFWGDLLRNDETTYIAVTRHPVTGFLFQSLRQNRPYDEWVAELLNPRDPAAAGFVKGIDWTFSSSVSEVVPMQVAQVTAQAFLGVNLKCASCHDHFTKDWKLEQSWAMAGFFAETNLQPHRCDKPRGEVAAPQFLFDGLGAVPADTDRATRLNAVSLMVTRPSNPRFARTLVNRLFKRLIGQGLINTPDDLDGRAAFKPELLDWLAHDFMAHDYDLKHALLTVATSKVYRMTAADGPRPAEDPEAESEPPFIGPRLRRLTAEQFLDAVSSLTGHWPAMPTVQAVVPGANVRAWRHKQASKLVVVMGRPNREVVVSDRPDAATMLQALEMSNGEVLNGYLSAGAEKLLASELGTVADPRAVMDVLCLRAYARPAKPEEVELAKELLGSAGQPAAERKAGWEDLLWVLVMSPEFQYLN